MTLSCSFAWIRHLVACLLLIGLVVGHDSTVFADKPTKIVRYEGRLEVQPNGDVIAREQMHFPTLAYFEAKNQHGGPVALFRMLQQSFAWSVTEDMKFQLDDHNSRLNVDFRQIGAVRSIGNNRWSLDFINGAEMELVSIQDNKVVLTGATESGFGVMSHTTYVTLPSTSSDIKLTKNGKGIEYVYEPPLEPGDECQATFDLESKKHLMSSLASVYSNREFPQFWAARSIFKNSGDQLIKRYRVRFRVPNHTGWSEWAKSERVYPGQTVIDPYFPVFDLESISKLTTSRRIAVEIEYEYQRADGETIKETETTRLELLARNQVVFGGRENGESITWHEQNEYLPFVMAAFCTSDDPVIQQLAGRVSGMGNGLAASLNDEAAIAFLQSLWLFMEHNRIVYQTPPTMQMNNTFGQNIKYARDVLRNRAGTCIDLAVFWASAAKAVGLEAHVVLIPGHAYPVIKLPSGQMVPIEATLIGRGTIRDAVETGMKNLAELNAKPNFEVSVSEYQNAGIRCLELPAVSDNWLEEQKYEFPDMVQETRRVTYEETSTVDQSAAGQNELTTVGNIAPIIGQWQQYYNTAEGEEACVTIRIEAGGTYVWGSFKKRAGTWVEDFRDKGRVMRDGNFLILNAEKEGFFTRELELSADSMKWYRTNENATRELTYHFQRSE